MQNPESEFAAAAMQQPLMAHLTELRQRLVWVSIAVLCGFAICYYFAPEIYAFLVKPLAEITNGEHRRLIYTGLTEAFVTYIKLALWGGSFIAFPVVATQIWLFVAPGLYREERAALLPFLLATPVLFLMGAALAYYFVFPTAWKFFLGFETLGIGEALPIQLEARVSEYLSLSMTIIFAFGLSFELPVLLLLLVRVGVLTAEQLTQFRRFAIVLAFVIAAVLTPPDVVSQICLAVPLMLLYEIAIWGARWIEHRKQAS